MVKKWSRPMVKDKKLKYQSEGAKTFNFDWPEQKEVRTRLRDFLEDNVDEKYYLSEDKTAALIKQLVENAKEQPYIVGVKSSNNKTPYDNLAEWDISVQLIEGLPIKEATIKGYTVASEGDAVNIAFPNSNTRRGRVGKQMANTIEASGINQGVVERVGNVNPSGNSMNGNVYSVEAGLSPTLTTNKGEGIKFLEDFDSPKMLGLLNIKGNDQIRRVYSADGQSPTLTTMQGGQQEPKIVEEVRSVITPDRSEKRQKWS